MTQPVEDDRRPGEFVQSLDRGLAVIRAFSDEQERLTLADVARTTGMSRASARRFLLTLQTLGYVGQKQGRFYLRPRVLDLGYAYLSSSSDVEVVQDHLERLSARTGESSSATEYDDGDVVYVALAAADRIMTIRLSVGRRLPAFCTSTGRVLLSQLGEDDLAAFLEAYPRPQLTPHTITDAGRLREELAVVRERGWALNDQEIELGARSIAAGVREPGGRIVNAVSISASSARVSLEQLTDELLPQLLETTAQCSADLALLRRG
jgi:IclR family pca regulon transcriptional regulator